ncbi:hypothetical protein PFISCL1PPCAC_27999, partial [Pristionchus fissidentatus]
IPAAPIFGAISTALKGTSTAVADQFFAYRNTLFLNVALTFASAIFTGLVAICYYERDSKAIEKTKEENDDESTAL